MHFKIITAIYNAQDYFVRYAKSIATQDYDDYEVIIVDDCSEDRTPTLVEAVCEVTGWSYILQSKNRGALHNQVQAIRQLDCQPDDVLVFVDGDDRLAHPQVLSHLVDYYADGTKLTYGQYVPDPPSSTCTLAAPYPPSMLFDRNFRAVARKGRGIFWNHLRTFKYEIFAQMDDGDFLGPEGWYKTATDAVMMYPAMELAAPHIKFIDEVLYIYTSDNPISDWRRWATQCNKDHQHVLQKPPKR